MHYIFACLKKSMNLMNDFKTLHILCTIFNNTILQHILLFETLLNMHFYLIVLSTKITNTTYHQTVLLVAN